MHKRGLTLLCAAAAITLLAGCKSDGEIQSNPLADPAEVTIGERLFLDTRFAQFFATHYDGNVNHPLSQGDPTVDVFQKADGSLIRSPFAGQSINCRSCHAVDDVLDDPQGGMRAYADFASRSPVPPRPDGVTTTPRNAQPLVNATLYDPSCDPAFNPLCTTGRSLIRPNFVLHFDGEFATVEALVAGTLTGRDFAWLPSEHDQAVAHIAKVVCEDNGTGALAQEFGGVSYTDLLAAGTQAPPDLNLPNTPKYRLNLPQDCDGSPASNQRVLQVVSNLIGAYLRGLQFSRNLLSGLFNGSPYDAFLLANMLPQAPDVAAGQTPQQYTGQIRQSIKALAQPIYVGSEFGPFFEFHRQAKHFGPQELRGLKLFLSTKAEPGPGGSVGNCASCHSLPNFTDFDLHNTGINQLEYDGVHGDGAFMALAIPDAATRASDLPATPDHPNRSGRFRAPATSVDAGKTDLGAWNIVLNGDFPAPQPALTNLLCGNNAACGNNDNALLQKAIATFKTPGLRDLGHSDPYMHNGAFLSIEDAVRSYVTTSELARQGKLRNAAPKLLDIQLTPQDVLDISAFLRSLNEDYS